MKKGVVIFLLLFSLIVMVKAEACDLKPSLINQDPYPAVPGDYVKLVFQVEGVGSSECGDINFFLLGDYPLEFDPNENGVRTFKKIDYIRNYESNMLVPYKIRVDKDALDGTTPIEAKVQNKGEATLTYTFDLEVDDVRSDFEVNIKEYNYKTQELILEILNIGDSDVEALTVEIPKQDNAIVKGSNRIVVGDLDSNEYTTADFESIPSEGEIKINLIYSDAINVRRTVEKTITFDPSYFTNRLADQSTTSKGTYLFYGVILLIIVYYFYNRWKKKKAKQKKHL